MEIVDLSYPALREFGRFAVEDPPSEVSEGLKRFGTLLWGAAFPSRGFVLVVVLAYNADSDAASVSAARAQPPRVSPLRAASVSICAMVFSSTEVEMDMEPLPVPCPVFSFIIR